MAINKSFADIYKEWHHYQRMAPLPLSQIITDLGIAGLSHMGYWDSEQVANSIIGELIQ